MHSFSFPTTIEFGAGTRSGLGAAVNALGSRRPILITDSGIANLPIFQEIRAALEAPGRAVGVYADFAGNPIESYVTAGVLRCREHEADAIVALGGGATLDVAKAIALMMHHPGQLFDYEDGRPDARPVDQPILPIIALPTTAGTGSEVGRSTVISDDQTKAKKIIFSPRLLPQLVIADPELTLGLPPHLTAATGLDALTHCVETYLAQGYHPMCDGIALEGVRLIANSLVRCYQHGDDIEARSEMLMASIMGAVAFQKGLGVTHSLAHALSTVLDMHHGLANGIMIPYAMSFNNAEVPDRLTDLAKAVGLDNPSGEEFIAYLEALKDTLGIPAKLREVGVTEEHLEPLTDVAFADGCHPLNPRTCHRGDLLEIYRGAL